MFFIKNITQHCLCYIVAIIRLQLTWLLHFTHDVTSNRHQYSYSLEMGHKFVTSISDIPHHVLVVYGNLYCSGSLVRSRIVLTTASCLAARPPQRIFVKVGGNSITGMGQVIPVIETKIHEYFRYYSGIDNDIALLLLKCQRRAGNFRGPRSLYNFVSDDNNSTTGVVLGELNSLKHNHIIVASIVFITSVLRENVLFGANVKKVILVEPEYQVEAGMVIEVSGWGSQNLPQKHANLLLSTQMVIMAREDCVETYTSLITPSNFCAKYQGEHRMSDIGGPAVYKQHLIGITSYGATNEHEPHVAILSNITYFHKWIMLNTKRFLENYCVPQKEMTFNVTKPARDEYNQMHIGLLHRIIQTTSHSQKT